MDNVVGFVLGVFSSLSATLLLLYWQRRRFRLRFGAILARLAALAIRLKDDGFEPDYIVAIDRNSGIVGCILAGHIGLRSVISVSTVNRRLPDGGRQTTIEEISEQTLRLLRGRRVLVMVCCNNTGTSLRLVANTLAQLGPDAPSEIRTAALYTTNLPTMVPTYHCAVVGKDTRHRMDYIMANLPWMTKSWHPRVPRSFEVDPKLTT